MEVGERQPANRWLLAIALIASIAVARPAAALFHEILIVEVFVGSAAAPDAQYVVLQMWSPNQSQLGGHPMRFYDANGNLVMPTVSFGTISNDADNATILIATSTAEALFGVSADLRVPVRMLAPGAKVCFDDIDCFSWGAFTIDDGITGTPFPDFAPDIAAKRGFTPPLDGTDDTQDSSADFFQDIDVFPRNNSGGSGGPNADALFLDGFEDNGFSGWDTVVPPVG